MNLDKLEILRYLGYNNQNIDTTTENLLNECINEINQLKKELFTYDTYDILHLDDQIIFKDTTLSMTSKDIKDHLSQSKRCTLMAASLGLEVDRKIAYYSKFDITRGLILDACASTAIEALCDKVEAKVSLEALESGYNITSRFSPGYGDLPITLQTDFTRVLNTYPKIGLTVNESSIMLPRKSVTALIGWQKEKCIITTDKCKQCLKKDCLYRKDVKSNE